MATERLILEPEVQQILALADDGSNFLLSGGAGSGKTYSLVHFIRQVLAENKTAQIACITYTNAAVKEIDRRVDHPNVSVSTIHDFLWDGIKNYQGELKKSLIELMNDGIIRTPSNIMIPVETAFFDELEHGIQYKEFLKIAEGIISHDEIIILGNHMYKTYPKLASILKSKFLYILIDEYQDTNAKIVEILLEFLKTSDKQCVIGFFGDSMQSIYDTGIGSLEEYLASEEPQITEVQKTQNRRSPKLVMDLANILRLDGIVQVPSGDEQAPNMTEGEQKVGRLLFLYAHDADPQRLTTYLKETEGWSDAELESSMELNLTHNLIATKAGFRTLMDIYDKDPIMKLRDDLKRKMKADSAKANPAFTITPELTFDEVTRLVDPRTRQGESKLELILNEPATKDLYYRLKDLLYEEVLRIYFSKDQLLDDRKQEELEVGRKGSKRDQLIRHLFKIENCITLYQEKRYNEFLRKTDYRENLTNVADKAILKEAIESLNDTGEKTIEEVIEQAHEVGIAIKGDRLQIFIENNPYLYSRVKDAPYAEFKMLYVYLEGKTPFSTQHKVKGAEFDNVIVILDNGGWPKYNFEYLFSRRVDKQNIVDKTKKLFYVCCTRAKEKLVVFYNNPSDTVLETAREWFGEDNVKELIDL